MKSSPGVDLVLEVRDVAVEVAALDVPLGVAGAAHADARAVARADEGDEVVRVAEAALGAHERVLARRADRPAAP